jgi:tether containing UBX domain for GLUT4
VSDPAIKTQTLAQLGLAPSSVIHVRWPDENANMNGTLWFNVANPLLTFFAASTYGAPLLPEVLAKAEELPIPKPDPALARPSNEPNGPTLESVGKDISKAANDVMKKMPKWFQAGMSE